MSGVATLATLRAISLPEKFVQPRHDFRAESASSIGFVQNDHFARGLLTAARRPSLIQRTKPAKIEHAYIDSLFAPAAWLLPGQPAASCPR